MIKPGYEPYAEAVEESAAVDPYPTLEGLSRNSGVPIDQIKHHILVEWATSYASARMAASPLALRQLKAAAEDGDLEKVKGITSWLIEDH